MKFKIANIKWNCYKAGDFADVWLCPVWRNRGTAVLHFSVGKAGGRCGKGFVEKFTTNGVGCDVLNEKEIVRLLNLVNNPSYTHLEDTEFEASIPTLKEKNHV